MLYILAIVLGIVLGVLAGGRAANLLDIKFRKVWIVLIAFSIQILSQVLGYLGISFFLDRSIIIQGIIYCLMLTWFWLNRQYVGLCLIGAGCILNTVVIMANGGRMPVNYNLISASKASAAADIIKSGLDSKHVIIDQGTRLTFLADIIHLPGFLGFMMQVVSIGDIVVVAGLFWVIYESVKKA